MSTLQRGILKYYIDGKFFQRIAEAQTPEELDSIYNELNADWEKEVVPISQDILDLFACNKHISKELFKKIIYKFRFNGRLDFFKKLYTVLEEYQFIKFEDLLYTLSVEEYEVFLSYTIEKNINISDALLLLIKPHKNFKYKIRYSEEQITYFWERRNEIEDNEQKKLFVKEILKLRNVSKKILFQAFNEFKNDIDMVVEVFVNGIEYPEIFSKVLETFDKDVILEKIKSNLNSTEEEFSYGYPQDAHILMSVARIADDNTLKRILNIFKENYFTFPNKEIFNSQDEQEILEKPVRIGSRDYSEILIKIMLSMSKNPNASLDTLKYIVQSTNDIETLYYCIINSGRNLEIFELIKKKNLSPVQENLKHNEVLARFDEEMENMKEYIEEYDLVTQAVNCTTDLGNEEDLFEKRFKDTIRNFKLWNIGETYHIYSIISGVLTPHDHCYKINNPGVFMDKIREQLKNLSFEGISLGVYSPDKFPNLQSKEKAYFDCLVNYGLVNDNDVRNFLATCLGEKYLRRYERDIALFNERGLDLAQTSKGAQQKG